MGSGSFRFDRFLLDPDDRQLRLGGAAGGLVVGAVVKLAGLDAFDLLFGQAPRDITGAGEGLLLGASVGLAGAVIPLLGGRLMGGSLDLLARQFPGSRLSLDAIEGLSGESGFGPISQIVTASAEGALFSACLAGGMLLAQRKRRGHKDRAR